MEIETDILNQTAGAFFGAFFAFLFLRLSEALKQLYDRTKANYRSLVLLELRAAEHINGLLENLFQISEILHVQDLINNTGKTHVAFNKLFEVPINQDLVFGILNIDVVNKVLKHNSMQMRLNRNIANSNSMYSDFKQGLCGGTIAKDTFKANFARYASTLKNMIPFFEDQVRSARELVAISRALSSRQRPLFDSITNALCERKLSNIVHTRIKEELVNYSQDSEQVGKLRAKMLKVCIDLGI